MAYEEQELTGGEEAVEAPLPPTPETVPFWAKAKAYGWQFYYDYNQKADLKFGMDQLMGIGKYANGQVETDTVFNAAKASASHTAAFDAQGAPRGQQDYQIRCEKKYFYLERRS